MWLTRDDVDRKGGLLRIRAKTIYGERWQPKTGRIPSILEHTPLEYPLAHRNRHVSSQNP
jgi:hypothetical protein